MLAQKLLFHVVGTLQGQATLNGDLLTYTLTLKDDGTASIHTVGAGIDFTSDTVFKVADDVLTLGEVGTESEEQSAQSQRSSTPSSMASRCLSSGMCGWRSRTLTDGNDARHSCGARRTSPGR